MMLTFIVPRRDGTAAVPSLVPPWLVDVRAIPGVDRVRWWAARVVPQPDDVSRSLNAVVGMGQVCAPERVLRQGVLPMLENEEEQLVRALLTTCVPEYDLLRDVPQQQYPHLTRSVDWKSGSRPPAVEPLGVDQYRYVYLFAYQPDVGFDEGEGWYLGHHAREGKQLPGLVRYVTWRRQGDPGGDSPAALGLVRHTELCFESFEAWHDACYTRGPRWTMPEGRTGSVWTDYHGFFLGPRPAWDDGTCHEGDRH